ncbi:MAG: hypothetical protein Q9157_005649 [Trypethelium eluteriae]
MALLLPSCTPFPLPSASLASRKPPHHAPHPAASPLHPAGLDLARHPTYPDPQPILHPFPLHPPSRLDNAPRDTRTHSLIATRGLFPDETFFGQDALIDKRCGGGASTEAAVQLDGHKSARECARSDMRGCEVDGRGRWEKRGEGRTGWETDGEPLCREASALRV